MVPTCPNCGAPVTGKYCSSCGQRHGDVRASFTRILRDVLEDQLSLNATLPRTLGALLFLPGRLTREYMSLRIARYVPPVRLYLASSVIFFLMLSFVSNLNRPEFLQGLTPDSATVARLDSLRAVQQKAAGGADADGSVARGQRFGVFVSDLNPDSNWTRSVDVNLGNEQLNRLVRARLDQLGHLPPREAFAVVFQSFFKQIPKVMFLLLPVYALLLKVLYIRRRRFFVEHFIFALHVHAFVFTICFLEILLRGVQVLPVLLLIWIPVYALIAMKQVYGQGWFKTLFKWFVLGNAYLIMVSFGVLLGVVLAVFSI